MPGTIAHPDQRRRPVRASSRLRSTMPRASRARIFSTGPPTKRALALIERWPDWPDRAMVLVGPEGSGKSHLAAIWAAAVGRAHLAAARSTGRTTCRRRSRPARWCSRISPTGRFDERALFHLLNLAREERAYVLMTARSAPASWTIGVPRSRLALARRCRWSTLAAPDDALLRAVIVKLFADRQLVVDESLVAYLATRIERSFAGARAGGGCARPRGAAAQAAGYPGAGGGAFPGALDASLTGRPTRYGHRTVMKAVQHACRITW